VSWGINLEGFTLMAVCQSNQRASERTIDGRKTYGVHTYEALRYLNQIWPRVAAFERLEIGTMAFGFVDDTNLVIWGGSVQDNSRRLEAAHSRCIAWAKRHGARFAPDKYQLIHFTRRRRDPSGDLTSTVRFEGQEVPNEATIRVLGVQVDARLNWREHVQQATQKGNTAFEALSRITASMWGPSTRPACQWLQSPYTYGQKAK